MMAGIDTIPSDRAASRRPCPAISNKIFIDENGCAKTKLVDAVGDLSDLLLGMGAGIFGVCPNLLDRQVSVPVGHDDAPFAGARASTRMGRQNQIGKEQPHSDER